jgi:GntR family transcriptional regulator
VGRHLVPRHQAIEEYLRERIAAAQPGDSLPTDKELCDLFGVSRMTARQAVSRLAEAGLVRREPGKGTFVTQPRLQREIGMLLSFTRQMERQGRVATAKLLERTVEPAEAEVAHQLNLLPGSPTLRIRRLRLVDGIGTALELVILPEERCGWLATADLEHGSLHAALEAMGIIPYAGEGTLTAEAADREEAQLLGLIPGEALLIERLVLHDQSGRPIQVGETRYAGSRYAIDFHLHR